ncbi:MAG: SPASM domain-containing protein [Aliidongia sp.]
MIEADGTVRPCFFHPPMGNIHDDGLVEILNSPDALTFRKGLDVRHDPVCRDCVCTLRL